MKTKIELINSHYSLLRISGLTVQPTPQDIEVALWRMEDMMHEFAGRTLDLNYTFEEAPDPNTPSGVDRMHHHMIASNLAMRTAIDYGKDVPPSLSAQASQSYTATSAVIARERTRRVNHPNRMPRGAGNRSYATFSRFFHQDNPPVASADNEIMFDGDIEDYSEDFVTYLSTTGGEISSFDISVTNGLNVVSSSINSASNGIDYRLEATSSSSGGSSSDVTLVITTSTGRVKTTQRHFDIKQRVKG